jgi:hypothetical protein
MSTDSHPPAWAERIVALLVPERGRDGVLGDLLEEYRESVLPQRGEAAADWWYVRQAAGFLWRASLPWAIVVGLILGVREVLDATVPTTDNFHFRAAVCTYLGFATYASAGVSAGWRSGRTLAGFAVSLVITLVATATDVASVVGVAALLSTGAVHSASSYEGLYEGLDVPILPMLIVGGALATIGAAIGKTARRFPRVDVA